MGASGLVSEPVVETLLTLTVLLFLSPGGRGAGGRRERGGERSKGGRAEREDEKQKVGWREGKDIMDMRREGRKGQKTKGRRGGSEKRKERSIVAGCQVGGK